MSRGPWAVIDGDALQHNLHRARQLCLGRSILAMVKSNAYGHGLEYVATALQDADAFGVACLQEALVLREMGFSHTIVLLAGFFDAQELEVISEQYLDVVIHTNHQLDLLEKAHLPAPVNVWLKVDTGMHRLGFLPQQVPQAYQRLIRCEQVKKPLYLMTHFADPDDTSKPTTEEQFACFQTVTRNLNCITSVGNSAIILAWPNIRSQWARPGVMLYGVSPMLGREAKQEGLRPVMTLRSRVIAVHQLRQGDAIGYGGAYVCPEPMPVAVVAIGYGDGYPRHANNGTPVLVNGVVCPLIGRVSMDMITVDLRPCPHAKVDDEVILWGEGLPIERVARCSNTIAYELLCKITARVVKKRKPFIIGHC